MHCARLSTTTCSSVRAATTHGSRCRISYTSHRSACQTTHTGFSRFEDASNSPRTETRQTRDVRASSYEPDASVEEPDSSEYSLSFLWLDKNLAVAVDQVFGRGHRSPITEYYWWPREDAWENLKKALDEREEKAWMSTSDKIKLLNTLTDVINYWSAEEKPSVRDAIGQFPGCQFQG